MDCDEQVYNPDEKRNLEWRKEIYEISCQKRDETSPPVQRFRSWKDLQSLWMDRLPWL